MEFTLNGEVKQYDGDPELSLLKYLRDTLNFTSLKDGCSGQGGCGACSVVLDDKTILSCVTPMKKVEGHSILTTEGLPQNVQDAFANAFVIKGAVQCGFCTPGVVMRAWGILLKHPLPTDIQILEGMTHNLCRCTGYKKIVQAIHMVAEALHKKKPIKMPEVTGKVGTRLPKYEAHKTVLGFRPFVCDMRMDGMLHGALRFSDHPRAKVTSIDTSQALKVPGLIKIFTASDIPGERVQGAIYQDWPVMITVGEETKYIGDVLCGAVATTEEAARKAISLIKIQYAVHEPVTDMFKAQERLAPIIGKKGNNILHTSLIKHGDFDVAMKKTAFTTSGVYTTQRIEHAFLEPECALAFPWKSAVGEKGVGIYSQSQGAYEDRKQLASMLGIKEERVNVIQVQNGGGFGGKEDLTVQGHAALFAWHLNKPVRVALTRDESMRMHPKRHPFHMEYTLGCDAKGKLTFIKANLTADSGAYASVGMKVIERAVAHATGGYTVPVVDVKGVAVYTNNIPCGAMRGFGVNQAAFAMEACMDELCEKGGFDRWQFRYDNALREGTTTATGQIMNSGAGIRACLKAVKSAFKDAKYAGIATGIKNTGIGCGMPDIGRCKIVIEAPDRVVIHHGWTEMGQGVHTMATQALVQETGISPSIVQVKVETCAETHCGMTTASRGTSLVSHSIIEACKELKEDLANSSLSKLVGKEYRGEWRCDFTTKVGEVKEGVPICSHYSYGYAAQVVILNDEGKIEKIIAAHDAGKIMNPTLFEGQIEGAIHMGLGYALSEDFPMENGWPVTTRIGRLGIIKARDIPALEVIGVEVKDPNGPFGAKGVGEIGLVPTAAAVANALYTFDKKRRYNLPIKEKCLK